MARKRRNSNSSPFDGVITRRINDFLIGVSEFKETTVIIRAYRDAAGRPKIAVYSAMENHPAEVAGILAAATNMVGSNPHDLSIPGDEPDGFTEDEEDEEGEDESLTPP